MAKKKIVKTNAIRMVEQKKIPYTEHEYEWDESHLSASSVAEQLPESQSRIFKTLVAVGNVTGPLVAVIPGEAELNLKKLAKVSGNKKVEFKRFGSNDRIHTWWLLAYRYEKTISYLFRSNCRKL